MQDLQDSKKGKGLYPITSLEQLLSSYLVAESIVDIREERISSLKSIGTESLPKLLVEDMRMQKAYKDYASLVNFNPVLVLLCKIALEDIERYAFSQDPSVVTAATSDTSHLSEIQGIGNSYTLLANIDLKDHTLRVFEIAILNGKKKGRVLQVAIPMLGALLHDFGKSTQIREELIGERSSRQYKAHAEVSAQYVSEILRLRFAQVLPNQGFETIEKLEEIVKHHHSTNRKFTNDIFIQFVKNADHMARKIEINQLR